MKPVIKIALSQGIDIHVLCYSQEELERQSIAHICFKGSTLIQIASEQWGCYSIFRTHSIRQCHYSNQPSLLSTRLLRHVIFTFLNLHDGYCDEENNIPECKNDGGDCSLNHTLGIFLVDGNIIGVEQYKNDTWTNSIIQIVSSIISLTALNVNRASCCRHLLFICTDIFTHARL